MREDFSPREEPPEAYTEGSGKGKNFPELNQADISYLLEFIPIEEIQAFTEHLADVMAVVVANGSVKSTANIKPQQQKSGMLSKAN